MTYKPEGDSVIPERDELFVCYHCKMEVSTVSSFEVTRSIKGVTRMDVSQMTPVVSSTISHLHYDPATETCTVRFTSGNQYAYSPMQQAMYDRFVAAKSVGNFFSINVRNNPQISIKPLGDESQRAGKPPQKTEDDGDKVA